MIIYSKHIEDSDAQLLGVYAIVSETWGENVIVLQGVEGVSQELDVVVARQVVKAIKKALKACERYDNYAS